jgi:hypothetical protein
VKILTNCAKPTGGLRALLKFSQSPKKIKSKSKKQESKKIFKSRKKFFNSKNKKQK